MGSNRSARWRALEECAAEVPSGGEPAWKVFMERLEPELQVLVRYQKLGRLHAHEDTVADVVLAVFEKLARDDYRTLHAYLARDPRPSFSAWMRRVVQSAAIDYMRTRAEYKRTAEPGEERWHELATLTSGVGARLPGTLTEKRRQLVRDLRQAVQIASHDGAAALARTWRIAEVQARRVANKGELYEPVLQRVFAGFTYAEIATELELSRREVELIVQYLVELFTNRYGDEP